VASGWTDVPQLANPAAAAMVAATNPNRRVADRLFPTVTTDATCAPSALDVKRSEGTGFFSGATGARIGA
jgi:hypothetical protein